MYLWHFVQLLTFSLILQLATQKFYWIETEFIPKLYFHLSLGREDTSMLEELRTIIMQKWMDWSYTVFLVGIQI